MSRGTLDSAGPLRLSPTGLSPSLAGLSRTLPLGSAVPLAVRTPVRPRTGLGSSPFARRYLGNHGYFLFLRLLRCFSSPGSLRMAIGFPVYHTVTGSLPPGFPIQISMALRIFAPPHGFSQLITSFFGS